MLNFPIPFKSNTRFKDLLDSRCLWQRRVEHHNQCCRTIIANDQLWFCNVKALQPLLVLFLEHQNIAPGPSYRLRIKQQSPHLESAIVAQSTKYRTFTQDSGVHIPFEHFIILLTHYFLWYVHVFNFILFQFSMWLGCGNRKSGHNRPFHNVKTRVWKDNFSHVHILGVFFRVTRLQHYKNVTDLFQWWSWRNNNYDVPGTTTTLGSLGETDQLFITISS